MFFLRQVGEVWPSRQAHNLKTRPAPNFSERNKDMSFSKKIKNISRGMEAMFNPDPLPESDKDRSLFDKAFRDNPEAAKRLADSLRSIDAKSPRRRYGCNLAIKEGEE
jgi:hypothetical protein